MTALSFKRLGLLTGLRGSRSEVERVGIGMLLDSKHSGLGMIEVVDDVL